MFSTFLHDEGGATAIEYAIIAALVGVAIVTALYGVRAALNNGFSVVSSGLNS